MTISHKLPAERTQSPSPVSHSLLVRLSLYAGIKILLTPAAATADSLFHNAPA